MELNRAIARRRMVRTFTTEPVPATTVDRLVDRARRAPSAGNTQGTAFVVLDTPDAVAGYWAVTFPVERRRDFRWPGLFAAPVLIVVLCSPGTYLERYTEADKAAGGLGEGTEAWSAPYWYIDAGMAVENLLLGVTDAGLGACFFGLFDHEQAVLESLAVPPGWRGVGTIALGHPASDTPGPSTTRPRKPLNQILHRHHW